MSKDQRYNKVRHIEFVEDDRWRFKGGPLARKSLDEPKVCPVCNGLDPTCQVCFGEGVIYD